MEEDFIFASGKAANAAKKLDLQIHRPRWRIEEVRARGLYPIGLLTPPDIIELLVSLAVSTKEFAP
jgi:hypothetical protein